MTHDAPAVTDLGVVDPLRLPKVMSRMPRWFRELPWVAKVFAILAVVDAIDLLVRRLGSLPFETDAAAWVPSFIVSAIPSVATLLLPVIVWRRTRDVARSQPLIASGVLALGVGLGLQILVRYMNHSIIEGIGLPDAGTRQGGAVLVAAALHITIVLLEGAGFLRIAQGLRRLDRSTPTPAIRRVAFGAAAIIVAVALPTLIWQFLELPDQLANEAQGFNRPPVMVVLQLAVSAVPTMAFGYLAWVLIRGLAAPGRRLARRIGALAAGLAVLQAVLTVASIGGVIWFRALAAADTDFETMSTWQARFFAVSVTSVWLSALGTLLLVSAFAFGLYDRRSSEAGASR
jgi:hypothetical protein